MKPPPGPDDIVGWTVTDPAGNIVDWGPPMELFAVATTDEGA